MSQEDLMDPGLADNEAGVQFINVDEQDRDDDLESVNLVSRPMTTNLYQLCAQVTRERGYWKDQSTRWMNQTQLEARARDEAAQLAQEVQQKELETRQKYERLLATCRSQRSLISKLQSELTGAREELSHKTQQLDATQKQLAAQKRELDHVHDYMGRGITVLQKRDLTTAQSVSHETARSINDLQYRNLEDNSQIQLQQAQLSLSQHFNSLSTTRTAPLAFRNTQNVYLSRSLNLSSPQAPANRSVSNTGDRDVLIVQRGGRSVRVAGGRVSSPSSGRPRATVSLQPISPGNGRQRLMV